MQPALLALVVRRMEDRHVIAEKTVRLPRRRGVRRRDVALSPRGAHIRQHLDIQLARQLQPPVPLTRARAARQPDIPVAEFEVARVEVRGLAGPDRQRQRLVGPSRPVEGRDADFPGRVRVVDRPREPFAPRRVRGRREQRHPVNDAGLVFGKGGQVRQVARRARYQAHHRHRPGRFPVQPPHARAVAERSGEPGRRAGLELRRGVASRFPGRQVDRDSRSRGQAEVVDAPHAHRHRFVAAVRQP